MRAASVPAAALAEEVAGTTSGDRLLVTAWRGGVPVAEGLEVNAWTLDWDASRQVQGQATFTIADPDGDLAPWAYWDALGPGGSRLQVTYRFGLTGTTLALGWWRIRSAAPVESWRIYSTADGPVRVPGGGSVTVTADEETASVVLDRLDPGERTPKEATRLAEVARLVDDYMAVEVLGVDDGPVPGSLAYDEGRMDAVEDLLDPDATYRMSGERVLQVVPRTGVGPVWTIAGGEQGVLVRLSRELSDDGLYNAVISTGETADNNAPLVGRAFDLTSPLAWGEDYGRVPRFHEAIATTAAGVQQDAETFLANMQDSGEVSLSVECLAHPGLQVHDLVTVVASTTAGGHSLTGRVVGMRLSSSTPAKQMSLEVAVDRNLLGVIAARVDRGR